MKFFDWLLGKEVVSSNKKKPEAKAMCYKIASEIMIREMAFNMVVSKIANAISKCEINVYVNNRRVKDDEWYRWNVQPNLNQSGTQFMTKLIHTLYSHNEALIVPIDNQLYVADSFQYNSSAALYDHTFSNIQIDDLTLNRAYRMSEVFYFKLNSEDIRYYLNGLLTLYGGLINAAYSSYLVANGSKGILKIDQFAEQAEDFENTFDQMVNEDFKTFFSNANAVMPLFKGFDYDPLDNKGTQTTTRDFKAILDDVIAFTANSLNVPVSIANGSVQDTSKSIDEMLTFCIDPLVKLLATEMTRKGFGKENVLKGCFYRFDTTAIKHIDLLDVANSIDKLISSGFTCINDLRKVCGLDIIDEPWANQFFMTKNYSTIDELIKSLEGGEQNE